MQCGAVRGWRPPRRKRWREAAAASLAMLAALALIVSLPARPAEDIRVLAEQEEAPKAVLPENVMIGLPDFPVQRLTITDERLLQGRMLVVDEAHPIPEGVNAPNTFSVLNYAHGRIACRDQQARLGKETLAALEELCVDARNSGVNYLTVFAGTRSREQQRILLSDMVWELSRDMSPEEAVTEARRHVASPGCSEHELPWSVDIRICRAWNMLPDAERLSESAEGTWLLEHAWVYGLIQRWPDADPEEDDHRPYCFRDVGQVHARLMHEMNMTMEEYLAFLQRCGAITLTDENGAPEMSVVCTAEGERHTVFEVPEGIELEDVSADNTGWALLSFTYR